MNFFKNWEDLFGITNFKIYVTGESYAGRYVPYISAVSISLSIGLSTTEIASLGHARSERHYALQSFGYVVPLFCPQSELTFASAGALVYDPCIGDFDYVQEEVPAVPFVQANNNLFAFNQSFLDQLESLHQSCGYADYIDKYLQFPPPGPQPPVFFNLTSEANCDVFDLIDQYAFETNPCFDIYEINLQCPLLWDVLSFPTQLVYTPDGANTYFNRTDVKTALHAPQSVSWAECSVENVFVGTGGPEQGEHDEALDPIQHVLPQVIEATNRVLVANGDLDMIILTNGTLISIQNMTWNGKLGFQTAPSTPIEITTPDLLYTAVFDENGAEGWDGPQGVMGVQHFERGLMWAETFLSGHMQPQFQPRVTFAHLQWLLGHTDIVGGPLPATNST